MFKYSATILDLKDCILLTGPPIFIIRQQKLIWHTFNVIKFNLTPHDLCEILYSYYATVLNMIQLSEPICRRPAIFTGITCLRLDARIWNPKQNKRSICNNINYKWQTTWTGTADEWRFKNVSHISYCRPCRVASGTEALCTLQWGRQMVVGHGGHHHH